MYAGATNERYRVGGSDIEGKDFNELSSLGSIKVFSCSALLRSGSRDVVSLKYRATEIPYYNVIVLSIIIMFAIKVVKYINSLLLEQKY